jgi:hypothetical protein
MSISKKIFWITLFAVILTLAVTLTILSNKNII